MKMQTRVLRFVKLLLKCYFVASGLLVLIVACLVIWIYWRAQSNLGGYGTRYDTLKVVLQPIPKKALSAKELAFGEEQVETMVRDRPEMSRYVQKGDPVWDFCARQFGGEAIGAGIEWNNSLPVGANSDYQIPDGNQSGDICVRIYDPYTHKKNTCEELWSYALYELCNIRSNKQQEVVWDDMLSGKINRSEFIKRKAQLEYQAYPYTVWIYNTLWKPSMEAKRIKTTPSLWGLTVPDTADAWFEQYRYTDQNSYPWNYGKEYDEAVMPILQQRREGYRPSP